MTALVRLLRSGWGTLRAVLGDDAYERYLAHFRRRHPGLRPLDADTFRRAEDERRASGISRCC